MPTTTAAGGVGSTIGNAFYLYNAKAVLIVITTNLAANTGTCALATIQSFKTFMYVKTDRVAGVNFFYVN